jgi:hypothetical protein
VSELRHRFRLNRPELYLVVMGVFASLTVVDACRPPAAQLAVRAYVGAVHLYQVYGRPISNKYIQCRFQPTCSVYSETAVERFGIVRGLGLTFARLISCRDSVTMGTPDPVPE